MQHDSKKHHFVPCSLLRYFSVDGAGDFIYKFDKRSAKAFPCSLENAGSQKGYNYLQTDDGVRNCEPLFDELDDRLDKRLRQIHGSRNLSILTAQDRRDWADIVAVQLVRSPITRTSLTQIAVDFVSILVESGLAKPETFDLPSDNDSRRSTFEMLADRERWRMALEDKDFVLFEPAGSARFWISDHPVVLQSMVPYGDVGLRSPGIAVYLPLAPDLVLGMVCKSAALSTNANIDLREGLRTGNPVRRPDEVVNSFNSLLVAYARFLYSSEDSFNPARALLRKYPELAEDNTIMRVGRLGEGLPVAHEMPDGQWLVLFGQSNHYMLQIGDLHEESDSFEIVTRDIVTLERALIDAPFSEMRLYQDRQQRQMMRNIRIEVLSEVPPVRIRVRSADPAMDALDAVIARSR
jgi:hypothetical protein